MKSLGISAIALAALLTTAGCGRYNTASTAPAPAPSGPVRTTAAAPGQIPQGTELAIRTNETINTTTATPDRTYSAQTAQAIVDQQGRVLVPEGSPVQLTVLSTREAGTVGTAQVALALRSITVNGQAYNVTTDTETRTGDEGLGANRRTAEMVGGGAVLGTVIGAIAGGGTGAAVGAAVGAAGGAAAQVLTRGDEVRVPAETVLRFRLDSPVQLQGFR
jgi:hypothetical protein